MTIKSGLLTIAGFALLGVGAVGVAVPILPTTPFVLVAAACFTGNPAIRARLLKVKFFQEYLTNYRQRTGLKRSTVAASLAFLWATMCISMLVVGKLGITLLLTGIGIAVTVHIVCMARPKKRYANERTQDV